MEVTMQTDISEHSLPVYEALASKVRLQVIRLLSGKPMNVRELAQAVGLSSAIMTMHIKKLEKAGIVRTEMLPGRGGVQKKCFINIDNIEVVFPSRQIPARACHRSEVSVGHYTDFRVEPTCGLATPDHMIGAFDDPRYFLDPERVHAKILWFGKGFVEYKVPNFLLPSQQAEELEISMEIASEAPNTNNHWPSDITFFLNGTVLGTWTSPGDFGDSPGQIYAVLVA